MSDNGAYAEAAVELGKGIALGMVPFLGQAIDAYDTAESLIAVYRAGTDEQKQEAQFDLLMAIVGWIPGPGDGVKKSLRMVNKDPERYAPVLFDLLRFVLRECGIETSPETLLASIFNAGKLQGELAAIKSGVESSKFYLALPQPMQLAVATTLSSSRAVMPQMVGLVESRLLKWKKLQRNSSAREPAQGRARQPKLEPQDARVASRGKDGAAHGHANGSVNSRQAEQPPHMPPGGGGGRACIVGKYGEIKCPEGQQAHHIVPDTLNRTGNRRQGKKGIGRIPGMPSLQDGPSICLTGQAKVPGTEHNQAHQVDQKIVRAANRTDNGPVGTLPVKEGVPMALAEAAKARPECKAEMEAALRRAYPGYENDNRSMNGAGEPPKGEAKAHLEKGGTAHDGNNHAKPVRRKLKGR